MQIIKYDLKPSITHCSLSQLVKKGWYRMLIKISKTIVYSVNNRLWLSKWLCHWSYGFITHANYIAFSCTSTAVFAQKKKATRIVINLMLSAANYRVLKNLNLFLGTSSYNGIGSLVIGPLRESHSGQYACVASNDAGNKEHSFRFIVKSKSCCQTNSSSQTVLRYNNWVSVVHLNQPIKN